MRIYSKNCKTIFLVIFNSTVCTVDYVTVKPGNVVAIVNGWRTGAWFPIAQADSGAHPSSYPMGSGGPFLRDEATEV
jgi:hypothetical protein